MSASTISHAFVVPSKDFYSWLNVLRPYLQQFERVAVIRGVGGNDLNPYRNVSAVTPSKLWLNDDPLAHIRRIYPQVVRVDIVNASTPQELVTILQKRVANNDRYGEKDNDGHIHDRFILEWPTDHRPYKIVQPFTKNPTGTDADVLGLEVAAHNGAKVLASVAGTVTRQWAGSSDDALRLGKYIQVNTRYGNSQYIVTYAGLDNISVPLNTRVIVGDEIGTMASDKFTVIVQSQQGDSGYRLPSIVNPIPMVYITGLRVRPTGEGLRARTIPRTDGEVIGGLYTHDFIIPKEQHGRVLEKIGVEGKWLQIRMPDGRNAYTAAWFLEATEFKRYVFEVNPVGTNLDQLHSLGTPNASRLEGIGWVRFGYNVSNGVGSEDIQAAYNRYAPLAEHYTQAGYKVLFTTSHQTYGEAKGYVWPQMTDENWRSLQSHFADMMHNISQQWVGKGLVHCWQIWNEQDAPIGAAASAPMSAQNYGRMLQQVVPAIRGSDSDVLLITGGHTSGPVPGSNYAKTALQMLSGNQTLDGVAFHPYGRGTDINSAYAQFGHIDDSIREYSTVIPDKPLWITEWGVLDHPNDSPTDIANYATNFISHLKARYRDKIACMIWYAWAQGMHNGYGIVDSSGNSRSPLTERFLQA